MMRRLLKFLHEVGTVGLMGAASAQLILSMRAEGLPPDEFATMRQAILVISEVLLLPSLLLVLLSGLWALAAHKPYHNAAWAWLKTSTTLLVLEGTLVAVQGPAQVAAEIARELAAGDTSRLERLHEVIRHERGGLWVVLFLSAANIALAVWRPKFKRRRRPASDSTDDAAGDEAESAEDEPEAEAAEGEDEAAEDEPEAEAAEGEDEAAEDGDGRSVQSGPTRSTKGVA